MIETVHDLSPASARDRRIEELMRIMPLIWQRAKPDPAQLGTACPGPLSASELRVMIHLALFGHDSAGSIATRIGLSRPATTEAIDRLQEKDLVMRAACPEDRRKVLLTLTPAAGEIARQFIDRWRAGYRRALDRLTEEEQVAFHKGMFALADALGEQESQGSA